MEDIGAVTIGKTKYLQAMYVYACIRKPGYVYNFTKKRGDYYHGVQKVEKDENDCDKGQRNRCRSKASGG